MTKALKRWIEYCRQNDFAMLGSVIALALVLSLLAGCANSESQPVVTDDDLTPASNVEELIEQVADNGKTYEYHLMEEGQEIDPIVPPQEAANRVGQVAEELYGLDMAGQTLLLHYDYHGSERAFWEVFSSSAITSDDSFLDCWVDATTGEIVTVMYQTGKTEQAEYLKIPAASCIVPRKDDPDHIAGWDTDAPEFAALVEQAKEQVSVALSGSVLIGGSQVTGVEYLPNTRIVPPDPFVILNVTCENGRSCKLVQEGDMLYYPDYNCGGYPLRGFTVYPNPETEG